MFSDEFPVERFWKPNVPNEGEKVEKALFVSRILPPFNMVLFSYYNSLSVNDIQDYLRLCCNPFNPQCFKFQAKHQRANQHLGRMFKACDLNINLFIHSFPDEDLVLLLSSLRKLVPQFIINLLVAKCFIRRHQICDGP